ncbi:MAG TPA: endonuclease/exonuclease/phosphatase family protein [Tepidisphaeraceae bacterium]|jgi:endonuclease/exonuclease/phosphatase family metal-dependent hydrolase|nr:endonuclease/exonuclease/phosphatase family protein [Tepidisphaeraceae bacterium]
MTIRFAAGIKEETCSRPLRFLWWNVQDLAHFTPRMQAIERWPKSPDEYAAKLARVSEVIRSSSEKNGTPELVALAEVTLEAAADLKRTLFPEHRLLSLDSVPDNPDFHVAVLFPNDSAFQEVAPFVAFDVPETTRPMAVLDYVKNGEQIRFISAHWTAPFNTAGERYQEELATQLRGYIHDFVHSENTGNSRHVVLMGDFNAEPFQVLQHHFGATRSRARARSRRHYSDKAVRRIRLYNCGWRLLGENLPHSPDAHARSVAGTAYWQRENTWHTWDQILVSGTLLTSKRPYLSEDSVKVIADGILLNEEGLPQKFAWNDGNPIGVSDHLPTIGTIMLDASPEKK